MTRYDDLMERGQRKDEPVKMFQAIRRDSEGYFLRYEWVQVDKFGRPIDANREANQHG